MIKRLLLGALAQMLSSNYEFEISQTGISSAASTGGGNWPPVPQGCCGNRHDHALPTATAGREVPPRAHHPPAEAAGWRYVGPSLAKDSVN